MAPEGAIIAEPILWYKNHNGSHTVRGTSHIRETFLGGGREAGLAI